MAHGRTTIVQDCLDVIVDAASANLDRLLTLRAVSEAFERAARTSLASLFETEGCVYMYTRFDNSSGSQVRRCRLLLHRSETEVNPTSDEVAFLVYSLRSPPLGPNRSVVRAPFDVPWTMTTLDLWSAASGIDDAAIAVLGDALASVTTLRLGNCDKVSDLAGFAPRLTSLDVSSSSSVGDAALARATSLVRLVANDNPRVSSVTSCAATLRVLHAGGNCGIGDAGLRKASGVRELYVSNNPRVTKIDPFAATLEELGASGSSCGITDAGLAGARCLRKLAIAGNRSITTVEPFSQTLEWLDISWRIFGEPDLSDRSFGYQYARDQLTSEEYSDLHSAFHIAYTKRELTLGWESLMTAIDEVDPSLTPLSQAAMLDFVNEVDQDFDGQLCFDEFVAAFALLKMRTARRPHDILEACRVFDKDGNGFISAAEVRHVMSAMIHGDVDDDALDDVIREADVDGDGLINYEELIEQLASLLTR